MGSGLRRESNYRTWQPEIGPPWTKAPRGVAFEAGFGRAKDALCALCAAAVRARFIEFADEQALAHLGAERGIIRAPDEFLEAYRARVADAWAFWTMAGTRPGMQRALETLGYTVHIIEHGLEPPEGQDPPDRSQWWKEPGVVWGDAPRPWGMGPSWSEFTIWLTPGPYASWGTVQWGQEEVPHTWGQEDFVWGSTITAREIQRIVQTVCQMKSGHSKPRAIWYAPQVQFWGKPGLVWGAGVEPVRGRTGEWTTTVTKLSGTGTGIVTVSGTPAAAHDLRILAAATQFSWTPDDWQTTFGPFPYVEEPPPPPPVFVVTITKTAGIGFGSNWVTVSGTPTGQHTITVRVLAANSVSYRVDDGPEQFGEWDWYALAGLKMHPAGGGTWNYGGDTFAVAIVPGPAGTVTVGAYPGAGTTGTVTVTGSPNAAYAQFAILLNDSGGATQYQCTAPGHAAGWKPLPPAGGVIHLGTTGLIATVEGFHNGGVWYVTTTAPGGGISGISARTVSETFALGNTGLSATFDGTFDNDMWQVVAAAVEPPEPPPEPPPARPPATWGLGEGAFQFPLPTGRMCVPTG